jgi:tRNA threonylcarbamoyladenosine biosynthesis protein TsaB
VKKYQCGKILAIDTATEQCSVAIVTDGATWSRAVPTTRGHADLILTMIDEVLTESGLTLSQIEGLAFGRGPGSFTGVRIAVSVIQGLALARGLSVAGVSNLAAVAQQAVAIRKLPANANILVCMDARMREVYWAQYRVADDGLVYVIGEERVSAPSIVAVDAESLAVGVGTGWRAYPELRDHYTRLPLDDSMLPRAVEVAQLGMAEIAAGRATTAAYAQPVYLRDQVVSVPK